MANVDFQEPRVFPYHSPVDVSSQHSNPSCHRFVHYAPFFIILKLYSVNIGFYLGPYNIQTTSSIISQFITLKQSFFLGQFPSQSPDFVELFNRESPFLWMMNDSMENWIRNWNRRRPMPRMRPPFSFRVRHPFLSHSISLSTCFFLWFAFSLSLSAKRKKNSVKTSVNNRTSLA